MKRILFPLLLFVISCSDSTGPTTHKPPTPVETFQLTYRVNLKPDSLYLGAVIKSVTYFPIENKSNLRDKAFQSYEVYTGSDVTLEMKIDSLVYVNCTREFAIDLQYRITDPWYPAYRYWFKKDTINNPIDSIYQTTLEDAYAVTRLY